MHPKKSRRLEISQQKYKAKEVCEEVQTKEDRQRRREANEESAVPNATPRTIFYSTYSRIELIRLT